MKLSDVLFKNEYKCDTDVSDLEFESITSDINQLNENCLFVFTRGVNHDKTKQLEYAIEKQPRAIVCDISLNVNASIPIIVVDNARKALSYMLSRFYAIDYEKISIIGVTGTNGKTTTATIIYEILKYANYKVGFIGTGKICYCGLDFVGENYSMTTPDPETLYKTIKEMQEKGCEVVVMEVSSHALTLEKVAPIPFSYSVFTNLSHEHMDFHKDIDSYYREKLKLFSQSKNGVFNADDKYSCRAMSDAFDKCNVLSVGVLWDAEAMARDVELNGFDGSTYIYRESNLIFKVKLKLPGYYNIYNSLLALKCTIAFGVKPYIAKEAVSKIERIDGRFEIIRDSVTVIIDYAHTEEAFSSILKAVNSFKKTRQNVITVFGCGGNRDRDKRPKMARAAEKESTFLIITQDNSRDENEIDIISDIVDGISDKSKYRICISREAAITEAIVSANDDDIILILGKGHEKYNIDKNGYHPFDEHKIVNDALKKRRERIGNQCE